MPYIGNKTADTTLVEDNSITSAKIVNDAVTVDKLNLISTSSVPSLEAKGTSGVTEGYIQLNCAENSHGIKIKSAPHSANANYTLTLPNNDGDANQFLQTNGSGVLSFADAGGGMTLLHADESTSSVSEKNYDYFSTTYTNYLIRGSVSPATDDVQLQFQWRSGGSAQTGSYYINNAEYSFVASGSNGTNNRFEYNANHCELAFRSSNNDDKKIDFEILVFDPMNTAEYKKLLFRSVYASAVSSWIHDYGSSYYNTAHTSQMNGFKLLTNSGSIDVRKVYIYGLTKA